MTMLVRDVRSPREAHEVVNELYQRVIKPYLRKGARGRIVWQTVNSELRHEMRKLFHGPILRAFSEQVWLTDHNTGIRYRNAVIVWKEHLKEQFCPMKQDPHTGLQRKSTELLSDDEFRAFIDEVRAYGITECGVVFDEEEGY